MATNPERDPIDDEVELALSDPAIRTRLEDFEARLARGEVKTVPNDEVRRRLGLDNEDTDKPTAR